MTKVQISKATIAYDYEKHPQVVWIKIPTEYVPHVRALAGEVRKKGAGLCNVTLSQPRRAKTTGDRSQNSRIHGHCADIAAQLVDGEGVPRYTADQIKEAMKRMSVENGYPTTMGIDGVETPLSISMVTVEQASIVIKTINRFADEHSLFLTEYDEFGERYLSIGGRTRAEMSAL